MYTKKLQVTSGISTVISVHDGKDEWNTDEYATAFLLSDWLFFFLWCWINHNIVFTYRKIVHSIDPIEKWPPSFTYFLNLMPQEKQNMLIERR